MRLLRPIALFFLLLCCSFAILLELPGHSEGVQYLFLILATLSFVGSINMLVKLVSEFRK